MCPPRGRGIGPLGRPPAGVSGLVRLVRRDYPTRICGELRVRSPFVTGSGVGPEPASPAPLAAPPQVQGLAAATPAPPGSSTRRGTRRRGARPVRSPAAHDRRRRRRGPRRPDPATRRHRSRPPPAAARSTRPARSARLGVDTVVPRRACPTTASGSCCARGLEEDGVRLGMPDAAAAADLLAVAELDEQRGGELPLLLRQHLRAGGHRRRRPRRGRRRRRPSCTWARWAWCSSRWRPASRRSSPTSATTCSSSSTPTAARAIIDDRDAYVARLHRVLARADVVKVSGDDLEYLDPEHRAVDAARALLDLGARRRAVHRRRPRPCTCSRATARSRCRRAAGRRGRHRRRGRLLRRRLPRHVGRRRSRPRATSRDLDALRRATERAVVVAGITCTRAGAEPPHLADLGT